MKMKQRQIGWAVLLRLAVCLIACVVSGCGSQSEASDETAMPIILISTDGGAGEVSPPESDASRSGGSAQADESVNAESDSPLDVDAGLFDDEVENEAPSAEVAEGDASIDATVMLAPLALNSVIPNSGPTTGGQMVRLVGAGFSDGMDVQFGGQTCLNLAIESETIARCLTPEGLVGTIPIILTRVVDGLRETAQLDDAYTYFAPVTIAAVEPQRVPGRGGIRMTIRGTGFVEGTRVRVDDIAVPEVEIDESGNQLSFAAPPHAPGTVDVSVENMNGQTTAPNAVLYYENLIINEVIPPVGPALGDTAAQLRGSGFSPDSLVSFVPNLAQVGQASPERTILDITVPPGVAGPTDVAIENDNGTFTLRGGYVYFDDLANGFQVAGIVPNRGPREGGNDVWVAGNGFTVTTTVTIGGRMADCTTLDPNRIRCVAPPGELGPAEVVVAEGGTTVTVEGGYTYFRDIEVVSIDPARGSIAGGTLVTLTGRGFSPDMDALLGESALIDVQVIDQNNAVAITAANTAGPVDVIVSTQDAGSTIIGGYT
ncbi:MAG: IPT/TIG domain-containing protein [Myxococcota bacterium]|nr:IPT/TIG domain-containing protein [Myxococcota bacterium]